MLLFYPKKIQESVNWSELLKLFSQRINKDNEVIFFFFWKLLYLVYWITYWLNLSKLGLKWPYIFFQF